VCCDVGVESVLPLDRGPLKYATANREDGVHFDVVARGWNRQRVFFKVRVFNSFVCASIPTVKALINKFMNKKNIKRMKNGLGNWRELAFFHLVLAATGGWFLLQLPHLGKLALCWLRSRKWITVTIYSGFDVGFVFLYWDLLLCAYGVISHQMATQFHLWVDLGLPWVWHPWVNCFGCWYPNLTARGGGGMNDKK